MNISPEDRLLRLIKGDKSKLVKAQLESHLRQEPQKADLKWKENFNYLTWFNSKSIMALLGVASLAYLIVSFVYSGFSLERVNARNDRLQERELPVGESAVSRRDSAQGEQKKEERPLEFYLENLKKPMFIVPVADGSREEVKVSLAPVKDLKNIAVVGIIAGDIPQAVIEDKEAQRTFYVSQGQYIGEYEVKGIEEGKIILELDGKKYELYL